MEKLEEIKALLNEIEIKLKELKNEVLKDEIIIQDKISSIYKVSEDGNYDYLKFDEYRFSCRKNQSSVTTICKGIALDLKWGGVIALKLKKINTPYSINGIEINSEVVDVTRKL